MSPNDASHSRTRPTSSRLERAIARVLILAMIGLTPGTSLAGDEFTDADQLEIPTGGSVNNSVGGQTDIFSDSTSGLGIWHGGLNQPADNTITIHQPSADSTFTNRVGGSFSAHLDGTLQSNGNVVVASPFGVFLGSEALIDVGSFVAIGASLSATDFADAPDVPLTGQVENRGQIIAAGSASLLGSHVANYGEITSGTGEILMLGGDSISFLDHDTDSIVDRLLNPNNYVAILGTGTAVNHGRLNAQNAKLIGSHVANYGEIEIADGSLMMLGADAIYVSQFDNPVLIRLPHSTNSATANENPDDPQYAVENHGQIRAGLGHVRLAASDPLGWGIRQGTGSTDRPASIEAQKIEIAGGDNGRVALSGDLSATAGDLGGEIDVTGDILILADAHIDASGEAGGGTIQIGGEQQGTGDLQRASALLVDEKSEVRADALVEGDGGRVILFSEDLTLIAGELSARGGEEGGNGGFIETSGLDVFNITLTPDASAPNGLGGEWLIDPHTINIVADSPALDCAVGGLTPGVCINRAIEAVLTPNFDDAAFDNIFRTVAANAGILNPNDLSVDLLVRALSSGTSVTLSTEITDPIDFDPDELDANGASVAGDINVVADIAIDDANTLKGTNATLTLRAAGSINIDGDITVGDDAPAGTTPNFALSLVLRANDQSQRDSTADFGLDQLVGNVNIDSDIRTGGGSLTASGVAVNLAAGRQIQTDGGAVSFVSGSLGTADNVLDISRSSRDEATADPAALTPGGTSFDPGITIAGDIDTSTPVDNGADGGSIQFAANGIGVRTSLSGNDALETDTGVLTLSGDLTSGGGDISLAAGFDGFAGNASAGSVNVDGSTISSSGGDIRLSASRVDTLGDNGNFDVSFIDTSRGEGGAISIGGGSNISTEGGTLAIGGTATQNISIDGTLDTTGGGATGDSLSEDGLIAVIAGDASGVDTVDGRFGRSSITIGANENTFLDAAGIVLDARDITTGVVGGANTVAIRSRGESTAVIDSADFGGANADDGSTVSIVNEGETAITGGRMITFNQNTQVEGDRIRITAAASPDQLNAEVRDEETNAVLFPAEITETDATRLTFGGLGGASVAGGVRLRGNDIAIEVGDGTTASTNLEFEALIDPDTSDPTDFALLRGTGGDYRGLQFRNLVDSLRPEILSVRQDGDLTLAGPAPTADSEIFFGRQSGSGTTTGAFGNAQIGNEGQRVTLESSDGVLTVVDATGLNNDTGAVLGADSDVGQSRVFLNGGLLLPTSEMDLGPVPDSVVFQNAANPFEVDTLTISTPRDFTITDDIRIGVGSVSDLAFQAGRFTQDNDAAADGTLTVEAGVQLQALSQLTLHAGASGFGDLVFEAGGGTRLASDKIEVRAGGGADSQNSSSTDRSRIDGIANVELRDQAGNSFQNSGTSDLAFSFRQDAAIDSDVDLPTFDQFGIATPDPLTFDNGGTGEAVAYSVRSDFSSIDFQGDALGGDRFVGTALSLVGLQSSTNAILFDEGFSFTGRFIELGGVTNFTYTQALADAFNPTDATDTHLRLRAAMNGTGVLRFGSSVVVKAARIDLIASEGVGGLGSGRIEVGSTEFDLSEAAALERTFVYQEDQDIQPSNLPAATRFIGGLPNVLALRSDNGLINIRNLDITALPIDLTNPARLILEADIISLTQTNGEDLALTKSSSDPMDPNDLANLKLRLRTNNLLLGATTASSSDAPKVLLGNPTTSLPTHGTAFADSAVDDESLLIEAFDADAEVATVKNLSRLSEDENDTDLFNLETGRGPTTVTIAQDGDVDPSELPLQHSVSGAFARSILDETNGDAIATQISIISNDGSITVSPETVGGSDLTLGTVNFLTPFEQDIEFLAGARDYDLARLSARTTGSIIVRGGSAIHSASTLTLSAAEFAFQPTDAFDADNLMGSLIFESGMGDIELSADQILLTAAPIVVLSNPDGTDTTLERDGDRDDIDDAFLAFIDFSGLTRISSKVAGGSDTSFFSARQAQSFDLSSPGSAVVAALTAGITPGQWNQIEFASTQGILTVNDITAIAAETRGLELGRANVGAEVVINAGAGELTPFAVSSGFEGPVRISSNNITFTTTQGGDFQLDSPNMSLVSSTRVTGFEDPDLLGLVSSDANPDAIERPVVEINQPSDFAGVALPRRDRYFRIPTPFEIVDSDQVLRDDLSNVDIVLTTTGSDFVLGDNVREGTTGGNLTIRLDNGGDVLIDLTGRTPGFDNYIFAATDVTDQDFAALQLNTLDIAPGTMAMAPITITIGSFLTASDELSIKTIGDQIWDGETILEETLFTSGRDIRFTGDVHSNATTSTAGLVVLSNGQVSFDGNLGGDSGGSADERLAELLVLLDSDATTGTPSVRFDARADTNDDGVLDTVTPSNQEVRVNGNIAFLTVALDEPDDTTSETDFNLVEDLRTALETATTLEDIGNALENFDVGRVDSSPFATVGKSSGNLSFTSFENGHFVMGSGERLAVGGNLTIDLNGNPGAPMPGVATLGDVGALEIGVTAAEIGLVRRNAGLTFASSGASNQDRGSAILANTIDFGTVTPEAIGLGKAPRFGVQSLGDPTLPAFLQMFSVFENLPDGGLLDESSFSFAGAGSAFVDQVPSPLPRGSSLSELTGAFGPAIVPKPDRRLREATALDNPDRLRELDVEAVETPNKVRLERLRGAAVIDDFSGSDGDDIFVTATRLDAKDAESAIQLYEELFGPDGERAGDVREVLQVALDSYLETTRARRVIGFELRRFVKNRPSSLLDAYATLDSLDSLFRFHRRLGLSPGEFRKIQRDWLIDIQPDGITLEELSEAIHPSRYVRGSDILDIFGR